MKRTVQLYINGEQADLFDDETISITSSIQNVRDIAKVFTDYSQAFALPASKTNNKIFKHYYDSDIVGGFDAQKKVDSFIELNNTPFKTGKLKLDSIQMKNNKPYAYKVTFFGNLVSLKDLLGDDLLSNIDFSAYNQTYDLSTVASLLETGATVNGVANAVITPLISAEERWFYDSSLTATSGNLYDAAGNGAYITNLKYAVRLYCIIKEIENTYTIANGYPFDLVFSNDFFNDLSNTDFSNLYMWLHREKGLLDISGDYSQYLTNFDTVGTSGTLDSYGFSSTGTNFIVTGEVYPYATYKFELFLEVSDSTRTFDIVYYKDGIPVKTFAGNTGSINYTFTYETSASPFSSPNGNYSVKIEYTDVFSVLGNDTATETYMGVTRTFITPVSDTFYFQTDQVLTADFTFIVSDNMPEIKVIDFLTGLFKMFNLTAYEVDGVIKVMPLNEFYDAPSVAGKAPYDITQYVDVTDGEISPSTLLNQINFQYKGVGSFITKNHNEMFNQIWGQEKYNAESKFEGEKYEVNVPFEHMKYERLYNVTGGASTTIQWGWMADSLDEDNTPSPYIGEPLIFYAFRYTAGTQIRIKDLTSTASKANYYIPMNSASVIASQTINFKAEYDEFTNTVYTDTLFNTYYADYIVNIFDPKNRITKVTAMLPLKVLLTYELNDVFIINGREYLINSISTELNTGESEIELINNYN